MKIKTDKMAELEKFGFVEDPANINEGASSHYASQDNYYFYLKASCEARFEVNMFSRELTIKIMCGETGLHEIYSFDILFDLITAGMVEL